MMLPSGNDAAWALAEFFGAILRAQEDQPTKPPVKTFVSYMNATAKDLGLNKTNFCNPHGLPNFKNRSTAMDVCKLAEIIYRD